MSPAPPRPSKPWTPPRRLPPGSVCFIRVRYIEQGYTPCIEKGRVAVQLVNRAGIAETDANYYVPEGSLITKIEAERAVRGA